MKKITNKISSSWVSNKIYIKKYLDGNGLFSKEKINKEEIVAIFGGYVMTHKEENDLDLKLNDYSLQINDNFVLGYTKNNQVEDACFFNHSCNPNCGFKGQIVLVAMKNIKKDEQITFDYAMVLSSSKETRSYKMKCLCGSKNCRGTIDEEGWKIPALQKKYKGYFQWYIEEKIKKLKNKKPAL